jgi:[protein-PII] uridylyltransferase
MRGTAREFVEAKLSERDERHIRAGQSRYLVEPNIKESKGGLRDLNTLFWIARYCYQIDALEELIKLKILTADELRLFRKCDAFLWEVRCHLHFLTGRAEERLSFDVQKGLATRFNTAGSAGMKSVEKFMRQFFARRWKSSRRNRARARAYRRFFNAKSKCMASSLAVAA